jgi:predicted transglutaminase/protease
MRLAHTFSRAIAALGIFTVVSFAIPAAAHADDSVNQLKKNDPSAFEWAEGVQEVNQGDRLIVPTQVSPKNFEIRKDIAPSGQGAQYTPPFSVYSDATLTVDLGFSVASYGSQGLAIAPNPIPLMTRSQASPLADITGNSGWGLLPMYYLVQYNDLETGKLLEHPIVRRIRVSDEGFLSRPQNVAVNEEDNGTFTVSWDPVEGAESYYLVHLNSTDTKGVTRLNPKLMAETSATSWNSDQREEGERKLDTYLNTALRDFFTEEDYKGLNSDGGFTDEELDAMLNGKGAQVAVIAKKGVKVSKMSDLLDISDTMGNTPIKIASSAWLQLNPNNSDFQSLSDIPTQIPMVMADGHTRLLPIIVDPERSWIQTGNPRTTRDPQASLHVSYHIGHSRFTNTFIVHNFDPSTYLNDLAKLKDDQEKNNRSGYISTNLTYSKESTSKAPEDKIARTFPDTPVQVLGSSALSKYIAANLMSGYTDISLADFEEATSPTRVWDALDEAKDQNGLVPFIINANISGSDKVLHVELGTTSATDQHLSPKDYSAQINSAADKVVADIIKPGMDDAAKVRAINSWIIARTTYNYDSYHRTQEIWANPDPKTHRLPPELTPDHDAGGVFFKGTTVCEGYANAFQLLALKSGVTSIVVTGTVTNGGGHAWNQVKINGQWKTVDVTWNDGGDSGQEAVETRYLMVDNNDPVVTRTRTWKDPAIKKIL